MHLLLVGKLYPLLLWLLINSIEGLLKDFCIEKKHFLVLLVLLNPIFVEA